MRQRMWFVVLGAGCASESPVGERTSLADEVDQPRRWPAGEWEPAEVSRSAPLSVWLRHEQLYDVTPRTAPTPRKLSRDG